MKKIISLFLLLAVSSTIYIGCESQAQETVQQKGINVKMVNVEQSHLQIPIKTSGVLAAKEEIVLAFKTGGVIKNILVEPGQKVKKGQLLAQLDLAEISARREQAESGLAKAQRDMVRIDKLYNEKVVTLEQKQNVQTALDIAKSNVTIATFNEKHSSIYAPDAGRILARFAEKNELTSPGKPMLAFGSTDEAFILKAGVSDKDVIRLKLGDPATILFDAFPGKIFDAKISQIAAAATPGSGTFEIELQIVPTGQRLYSGFIGKAELIPQIKEAVDVIPVGALMEAIGKSGYVFKVDAQNIAHKTYVKVAYILNDQVAIGQGLEDVKRVVHDGNAYLTDGSLVQIIE